jgi:hypothetical protein
MIWSTCLRPGSGQINRLWNGDQRMLTFPSHHRFARDSIAPTSQAKQEMASAENAIFSTRVTRILGLSLHGWENLMVASLAFAAIFAAIVGISTYCVVQLQRQEIASSNDELDRFKLETSEKISEANARQREAELELTRIRFPRSLDIEKFTKAVAGMKPAPVEVLYDVNAPDAYFLASLIWGVLFNAKWDVSQQAGGTAPLGPPPSNNLLYDKMPWAQAAGGGPWGLSVVTNEQPDFEKTTR